MKRAALAALAISVGLLPNVVSADTFAAGSIIIPMDTDYQDVGMLEAYGLVYELLRQGIPVRWTIKEGKLYGDADFVASSVDLQTNDVIADHGYRGGPWVIDSADAADAMPVITTWQTDNPDTVAHQTTAAFDSDVALLLVVAPTIAMFADGNQKIARKYMEAAKIPDSVLDYTWPDQSPDMLDPDEVSGLTDTNHADGALFDEDGDPVYCQLMSMHWGVGNAEDEPEVVAEVRAFLGFPTHFFAECQAVNAYENLDPHGFYLTENGFLFANKPNAWDFYQQDTPFAQLDGPFESVGGSEPAYSLPMGDSYKASDIVMITEAGTPEGETDVWMTGFLDGICPQSAGGADDYTASGWAPVCLTNGKVSYLGGHEYDTDTPISENPKTQGARLFLNSLFEAPCATDEGLPIVTLDKTAPAFTDTPQVTFDLAYLNEGPITALDVVLTDELPAGSMFISATDGGMFANGVVSWGLGNLGIMEGGTVSFTVELPEYGTYDNVAKVDYRVGLNGFVLDSNMTSTLYDDEPPGTDTGTGDASESASAEGTGDSGSASASAEGTGTASATATTTDGGTDTNTGGAGGGEDVGGCGCRSGTQPPVAFALAVLGLGLVRRRRAA